MDMQIHDYNLCTDFSHPALETIVLVCAFKAFLQRIIGKISLEKLEVPSSGKPVIDLPIFLVEDNPPLCPHCRQEMCRNGYAKRTALFEGVCWSFRIQVYLCKECRRKRKKDGSRLQYTHRALPEGLIPYRRIPADVLFAYADILELQELSGKGIECREGLEQAEKQWQRLDPGSDERTLSRWKSWYFGLKAQAEGILRFLLSRTEMQELAKMAQICASARAARQMTVIVRAILTLTGSLSI